MERRRQTVTAVQGCRGGGGRTATVHPKPPPPPTKVTIVGKKELYNRENLIGPFWVHELLGPRPPPPHRSKDALPSIAPPPPRHHNGLSPRQRPPPPHPAPVLCTGHKAPKLCVFEIGMF